MANHGFVKTKKPITQSGIEKIIQDLNESHFRGGLVLTTEKPGTDWIVEYISPQDGNVYATREIWINKPKSFEIRHGHGGEFAWWVDGQITRMVAERFDGVITDEGVDGEFEIKDRPHIIDLMKAWVAHVEPPERRMALLQHKYYELEYIPPEFKDQDLGERIPLYFRMPWDSRFEDKDITPGMTVWVLSDCARKINERVVGHLHESGKKIIYDKEDEEGYIGAKLSACYPTKELAEQAQELRKKFDT